jgi:hypothetical protein
MGTRKTATKKPAARPLEAESDGHYRVYWPRTRRRVGIKPLARRPDSLAGKKVAFLWDYVFRGDEIFAILQKELSHRYPGMTFVSHSEFGNTHGSDEHQVVASLPAKLKALEVDAVISGMGC